MSFQLKIVTPSSLAFEGVASEVIIPGWGGQYGVLPSHAQILTLSKPGILTIFSEKGESQRYVIGKGFVEFSKNTLTALVDVFEKTDAIDKEGTKERLNNIDIELEKLSPTDAKYSQLASQRDLEQARLEA